MSELKALNSKPKKDNNNVNKEYENKRKSDVEICSTSKHLKNNYWSILENDKNCDNDLLQKFEKYVQNKEGLENELPKSPKNVVTNNISTRENNTNRENTNSHKNNKKIPPINVYDVEPNKLIEFVKDGLKITEFKIIEFNNNKVSLYTSSSDDYYRIKAYFEKTKTKFFSYTSKDIKKKSYLLKGLSANIEPNEILDELNKFQNDNLKFVNVSPFVTKKSLNGDQNLPIYLVQITADSKVNELKTIKGILYRCIRWEALRKPEIPQCRNCQRFFHSATNCFLPRKCVKCNQNHEPGKCS